MTLIPKKISRNNKDVKFVGVHLPLQVNSYLTIYALANSISKSAIILEELKEWKTIQEEIISIDEMLDLIAGKAIGTFKEMKSKPEFHAGKFFNSLNKELETKGIDIVTIEKILKKVRDAKK